MTKNKIHIAVLIMAKNEKKRLHVTLESIKTFADSLIFFDTGSTDNTIEIARDFCTKYNIPFHLKQGEFVNFCVSRNESLDFADSFEDVDYLLLMDTNDELRGQENLRKFAEEFKDSKTSAFLLEQEWWSGNSDKYFNVRFIKSRHEWRYVGVVHEYIKTYNEENSKHPIVKLNHFNGKEGCVLYQDRTQDDDKSEKRFSRDKDLLLEEFKKDPTEPRTVFYLAQTCSCLKQNEETFKYYKWRTTLDGFNEEVFQSLLRCGNFSEKLKHDWYDSFSWYMKSFEHTPRVEPLVKISEYYKNKNNWLLCYNFVKLACELEYPHNCILFVDKLAYDYKRWHLLGICAYYIKRYDEGKKACLIAIENGKKENLNVDIDTRNLKFYIDKESELANQQTNNNSVEQHNNIVKNILTKKKFLELKLIELSKENPKLNQKQLNSRANMLWKNDRNNKK
jgi:glycosyltransferase involved in cell wall biosynthesis